MNLKKANNSIRRIIFVSGIVGALVVSNVLFTMITHKHLRSGIDVLASRGTDYNSANVITASRGYIRDRNNEIIAQDVDTYNIYAILDETRLGINESPAYVVNIEDTAAALAPKLNMEAAEILAYLNAGKANKSYQVEFGNQGKHLSAEVKESIDALGLPGIEFSKTTSRIYPTGKFASHLIGFAQYDEQLKKITGRTGLESFLDEELTGSDGLESYDISAQGTVIPGTKHTDQQEVNGNDVYLTLDRNVQLALETCLQSTMDNFGARRAWGIIMEVETGKILGWSSYPTYDMNERNIEDYINVPSEYQYEPGSVMKGFTFAAAIDSGVYPKDETYYADRFYIGYDPAKDKIYRATEDVGMGSTINDALEKNFGTISFDEGFMRSSNVAVCELLANYLSPSSFETYLDKFGFFKAVDTYGLEGHDAAGVKNFLYPSDKLSTGFGQASSVTALQLVQGYTAIFNDGKMMKPYYIDRVVNPYNGEAVYQAQPQVVGQPISEETSQQMRDLMHEVVQNDVGTAHNRYRMDDIDLIAKTGTGEIFGEDSNGYYVNSVIAAAPYDDPKIMMYYAFESKDILNFNGEPFKQAFKEAMVASSYASVGTSSEDQTQYSNYKEFTMPSLINHTLAYTDNKLYDMSINKVIIGDGTSIVRQYPLAKDTVITGQNIFLITDGTTITMPNMVGWSRKDVSRFWELTGIGITMDGFGIVKEQSIAAGETIDKFTDIKVTMK